ncbi:protein Wnt-16-like [Paramacrobiotus metropolitanus]|uniref:protein Wnt-16-like n=1 Tax=Paramacrobiotus metropolitanus TaxID=2943436 RepID=UPI002445FFD2|nr:protein Wnt-16-like [Paramacrobiotus metropolitanus]
MSPGNSVSAKWHILPVFTILFIFFVHPHCSTGALATWMHIGIAGSSLYQAPDFVLNPQIHSDTQNTPDTAWCSTIPGLVDHQLVLCRRTPIVFAQVSSAAKLAIMECQNQFRHDLWNCTTTNDHTVFGKVAVKGNRETAFIAAISSAAVVHAVVRACSSGNLTDCSCDMRREGQRDNVNGWKWSGCSDNVEFGMEFSRLFNDAPEDIKRHDSRSIRDVMHLHNKAAGRMAVQRSMKIQCRCHGVSGSCEMKTCWNTVQNFHVVGSALKKKYSRAVWIAKKSISKLKRREMKSKRKPIRKDDLVYIDKSPDYCRANRKRGIPGTTGRICNSSVAASNSCKRMCCGRGHYTKVVWRKDRCKCKFIWCCNVQCEVCQKRYEINYCR